MEENNIDLHEAEETAAESGTENQADADREDGEAAPGHEGSSDQSLSLRHPGEVRTAGTGGTAAPEDETATKRRAEILEFLEEYGTGFDPKTIPREVWQAVAGGRPLLAAYQAWELKKLRLESAAAQKNTENKTRSAGSRSSLDTARPRDAITEDWYNG